MIDTRNLILYGIMFLIGFLTASMSFSAEAQMPFSPVVGAAPEVASPQDWISEDKISVTSEGVFIMIKDPQWAKFTDTNSMLPVFDQGHNTIAVVPSSPEQIEVGDIISYESKYASGVMIHRVAEIGQDEDGWYAITKGDNNPSADPGRIRFSQIKRVTVAVIY